MTPSQGSAAAPQWKLLGTRSLKVRIAFVSALVLVVGAWLAPEPVPTALSAPPQERAAPLLEEQVQLRDAVRPFAGVQEVALRLKGHSVAILPVEPPTSTRTDFSSADGGAHAAGFGVFVSDTHVLTHAAALNGRSSNAIVSADGQSLPAEVVGYEPSTGLVLLRTGPSDVPAVAMAAGPPDTGALAVAAGSWEQREIVVPVFVTSVWADRFTLGGAYAAVLPGMPVFNINGELFAVASGDLLGHAYPVRESAERLMAGVASGPSPGSFGVGFQDLLPPLTRVFGDTGVLVTHVVQNGPADAAGIAAGDVIAAIGDVEIDSSETAVGTLRAAQVESPVTVRVLRNGRVRRLEMIPVPSYELDALARATADAGASGPEARAVFTRSVLEGAAIPATARVLAVDGRAVSSRVDVEREFRRRRNPVPVLLRQGETRFFAAIEPAP
jgi:S1-C subfamily serine protease